MSTRMRVRFASPSTARWICWFNGDSQRAANPRSRPRQQAPRAKRKKLTRSDAAERKFEIVYAGAAEDLAWSISRCNRLPDSASGLAGVGPGYDAGGHVSARQRPSAIPDERWHRAAPGRP